MSDIIIDDPVQAIQAEMASGRKIRADLGTSGPMIFEVPLQMYPYQPWARHPNPSAWFNYGLRAETWSLYAESQKQIKHAVQNLGLGASAPSGASRNLSHSQ